MMISEQIAKNGAVRTLTLFLIKKSMKPKNVAIGIISIISLGSTVY